MRTRLAPFAFATTLMLPVGCQTSIPEDDAGDAAFVRQVVPTLLGRRVLNHNELTVLLEVVQEHGRDSLVDLLMVQPEFVDHWSQVIIDDLEVNRQGGRAHNEACYAAPLLNEAAQDRLVFNVVADDPRTVASDPWNMSDLVRGAIRNDRLDAAYRGYLFVFPSFPGMINPINDLIARQQSRDDFLSVYLGRDSACLSCHSSTFSTVDGYGRPEDWDRHAPGMFDLEGAVFSYVEPVGPHNELVVPELRYGGQFGEAEATLYTNLFRTDAHIVRRPNEALPPDSMTMSPWGMDAGCTTNIQDQASFRGYYIQTPETLQDSDEGTVDLAAVPGGTAGFDVGIIELANAFSNADQLVLRNGAAAWNWSDAADGEDLVGYRATASGNLAPTCNGCHGHGMTPALSELIPFRSDGRILKALTEGYGPMPAQTDTYEEATDILAHLRTTDGGSLAYRGDVPLPMEFGTDGFKLAVATQITNNVFEEVTGSRLTSSHGQPRNAVQADVLTELTRRFAVDHSWSLRGLLRELVLDESFNRTRPSNAATSPYPLPMVLNPWAENDPREAAATTAGADANDVGDSVHRWSIPSLYSQVHHMLGWPAPRVFPLDNNVYPNQDDHLLLGGFLSSFQSGSSTVSFQSYWTWEQMVSTGEKPTWVLLENIDHDDLTETFLASTDWERANNGEDDDNDGCIDTNDPDGDGTADDECGSYRIHRAQWMDWPDRLHEMGRDEGATVAQVAATARDRVLSDGDFSDEEPLVAAYFNSFLTTPDPNVLDRTWASYSTEVSGSTARTVIRGYVGLLLTSPQFMLAGIASSEGYVAPPEDLLEVCLPSQPCTADEFCYQYSIELGTLGTGFSCQSAVVDLDVRLRISGRSVQTRFPSPEGWTVPYEVTVTNVGLGVATEADLELLDSNGSTSTREVPPLARGQFATFTTTLWVPRNTSTGRPLGTTWLEAEVDPMRKTNDSDRSNNTTSAEWSKDNWFADYRISDPDYRSRGNGEIDIHFRVANVGAVSVSTDRVTSVEVWEGQTLKLVQAVPGISSGRESLEFTYRTKVGCTPQDLTMVVNGQASVREGDEANNELGVSLSSRCWSDAAHRAALRVVGIDYLAPEMDIRTPVWMPQLYSTRFATHEDLKVVRDWVAEIDVGTETIDPTEDRLFLGSDILVFERWPTPPRDLYLLPD